MKEGEDQVQEVLVVQVVQEDPLDQEHILTLGGVIKGILITEARDRLGHQGDTVATLHIPGVMVAIPLILKATPKENEVQVLDQVTHRRDTVVPDLTQTAPLPPAQTVPKTLNLTPLTPGSILQINPLLQVITPTAPLPLLANTRVPPPQPGRPPSITAPLDQRDLPTPYPHPDHPLKRKGDSLAVTMVDQRVQSQG